MGGLLAAGHRHHGLPRGRDSHHREAQDLDTDPIDRQAAVIAFVLGIGEFLHETAKRKEPVRRCGLAPSGRRGLAAA